MASKKSNASDVEIKPLKLESGEIWNVASTLATQMLEAADKSVGLREKDLKDFNKKLKSLQKLVESEAGNKTARNSLDRLSSRRDEQIADLEALNSHQSDVVSLKDAIFSLRDLTSERDALYEKAMAEIESLNAQLEEKTESITKVTAARDGFAKDIAKLTGETEKLKAANEALKQQIDRTIEDKRQADEQAASAEAERSEAVAKMEALRVECDEQAQRGDLLEAEAAEATISADEAVQALKAATAEHEKAFKALQTQTAAEREAAKKAADEAIAALTEKTSAELAQVQTSAAAELAETRNAADALLASTTAELEARYNALSASSSRDIAEAEKAKEEAFSHALELQKVVDVLSDHGIDESAPVLAAPGPAPVASVGTADDLDIEMDVQVDVDMDLDEPVREATVPYATLPTRPVAKAEAATPPPAASDAPAPLEQSPAPLPTPSDAELDENKDAFADAFAALDDEDAPVPEPPASAGDELAEFIEPGKTADPEPDMEIVGMDFPSVGEQVDQAQLDAFLGDSPNPASADAPAEPPAEEANTDFESVLFSLETEEEVAAQNAPSPVPLAGADTPNLDPPVTGNPMIRARPRLSRHKYQTREAVRIAGILDHNAYQVDELIRLSGLNEDVVRQTLGVFRSLELIELEDA